MNTVEPSQYDELRIEHDQGEASSTTAPSCCSRTDTKAVKRIHEVCCRLDDLVAR